MAFVAVDENKEECIYEKKPHREKSHGFWYRNTEFVGLPKGTIEKLIGKKLTWEDEPVELKEKENE